MYVQSSKRTEMVNFIIGPQFLAVCRFYEDGLVCNRIAILLSQMFDTLILDKQNVFANKSFFFSAHRLQVSSMQGDLGEVVPLNSPVPFSLDTCKWLSQLEFHMKSTIQKTLQACVEARLDGRIKISFLCLD